MANLNYMLNYQCGKQEIFLLKKEEKLKLALQFTEISAVFVTVGNNIQFASDCKSII